MRVANRNGTSASKLGLRQACSMFGVGDPTWRSTSPASGFSFAWKQWYSLGQDAASLPKQPWLFVSLAPSSTSQTSLPSCESEGTKIALRQIYWFLIYNEPVAESHVRNYRSHSNIWPGQYLDGRLPGKSWCCWYYCLEYQCWKVSALNT